MSDTEAQVHRRHVAYRGHVNAIEIDVTFPPPDGARREVVVADPPDAVAVLPLLEDESVVLVRQYRPAVERTVTEIPAGGIEAGEPPETTARRELEEETGLVADRLRALGTVASSPGVSTERLTLFLAEGCRAVGKRSGETVEVVRYGSIEDAVRAVAREELRDAKTLLALVVAQADRGVAGLVRVLRPAGAGPEPAGPNDPRRADEELSDGVGRRALAEDLTRRAMGLDEPHGAG